MQKETLQRKEQEADNSREVYRFIRRVVDDPQYDGTTFQYTEALIKQIHHCFTRDINYLSNVPGAYRGDFVPTFGHPRKQGLCRTTSDVQEAMAGLVEWLNKEPKGILDRFAIVKAIMAHYYLSEIHPFGDGNGRTARALEAFVLYVNGTNRYCFWSLANFWAMHVDQYLAHLDSVRATCNPWEFLVWGMHGYLEEITGIKRKVLKKVKALMFLDYVRYVRESKREQDIKITDRIVHVLKLLVSRESIPLAAFLGSPEVSALYNRVAASTRSRDFKKMRDALLIRVYRDTNGKVIIEPNDQILETIRYDA